MATSQSGGIDPRFPEAYQRGGAAPAPVLDDAVAVRGANRHSVSLPGERRDRRAATLASPAAGPATTPGRDPRDPLGDDQAEQLPDERHFELVVAGNPWLRALWVVGSLATVAGFALTVYAEFAFSIPPASGIYDPSVYIVPRIAEAVAQPLVIAGVIALVAATALRIVAWRPSRITAVIAER